MLTAGCASSFHWFCELCEHAQLEAGLKSELTTSNPTVGTGKRLRQVLTLVDFWTRTTYMCMRDDSQLSAGSGEVAPVGLHAGGFVSSHACLRDL